MICHPQLYNTQDNYLELQFYTAEDFCIDNPIGVFVLGFGGHVATVVDGNIFDSWDSSQEIPIYVWYKK